MKPLLLFALILLALVTRAQQKIVFDPEYAPQTRYITINYRFSDRKVTNDKGDTVRVDTVTHDPAHEITFVSTLKTGRLPKTGKLPFSVHFTSTQTLKQDSIIYHTAEAKGKVGPYGQLSYETASAVAWDKVTYKSPFMQQFEDELGPRASPVLNSMDTGSWYVDTIRTQFPFAGTYVAATIVVTHTLTSITDDTARFDNDIDVIIDPKSPKLPVPVHGTGNGYGHTIYNWKEHYIQEDETYYTYELHVNFLAKVMHVTTSVYAKSDCIVTPADGDLDF